MSEPKTYTPAQLLERYGLRIIGAGLTVFGQESTGETCKSDKDAQIITYIEGVRGYAVAKPVLIHHYARFRSIEGFRLTEAGESLPAALRRLGWESLARDARKHRHLGPRLGGKLARKVYAAFMLALTDRCIDDPFVEIVAEVEDDTPDGHAAAATAYVEAKWRGVLKTA